MNVVMIMSGGVGTVIPKQYRKPVIGYVSDAVKCSALTDESP